MWRAGSRGCEPYCIRRCCLFQCCRRARRPSSYCIYRIVGERGSDVLIGGVAASFESSFGEMNAVYVGSLHVERRSTAVQTPFLPPFYRWCELSFAKVSSYILMYCT